MTFKKIMALGAMAMAAVAMSAPTAQAMTPQWYHNGAILEGQAALHITGKLSTTIIGGGGLISGPCEVTFAGEASNVNGMATGTINDGIISPVCETNVEGCTIKPTMEGFPWTLTGITVTETTGVEISKVQFTTHYISKEPGDCPVPVSTILKTGTMTGQVESTNLKCITFENHTDSLVTHAPLPTLTGDVLGTLCDTTLALN